MGILSKTKARAIQVVRRVGEVMAGYEGAKRGRRTDGWTTVTDQNANSEIGGALGLLRARSRDLCRNTWVGIRAVNLIKNNVVGSSIRPDSDNTDLEKDVLAWAKRNHCDADEMQSLYGLQALICRAVVESGEALVLREWRDGPDAPPVPMQIRVIEADYLDHEYYESLSNGNEIVQGVEFDRMGRRVAYWLLDKHPGDATVGYGSNDRTRVTAENCLHVFEQLRPGQVRGVPWFAPVLLKIRGLDEYEDAQLVRQKIAACFTAFVRKNPENMWDPNDSASEDSRPVGERVEPGIIEILEPGEDVTFGNPPRLDGYKEFINVTLHEIAAGLGVTYEGLTGDYSQVNYSSAQMGHHEMTTQVTTWQNHMMLVQFLYPLSDWLVDASVIAGRANPDDDIDWTFPVRAPVDPIKAAKAAMLRMRSGTSSLEAEIRKNGRDFEDVLNEIQRSNEHIDDRGIILDSDPRHQNFNGTPRSDNNQAAVASQKTSPYATVYSDKNDEEIE